MRLLPRCEVQTVCERQEGALLKTLHQMEPCNTELLCTSVQQPPWQVKHLTNMAHVGEEQQEQMGDTAICWATLLE